MLLEAKRSWGKAEKAYSSLLQDNPLDQVIHKRRVAMAKAQGNISGAIEWLNKYFEIFMADHDAWRELVEIYVTLHFMTMNLTTLALSSKEVLKATCLYSLLIWVSMMLRMMSV